MIPLTRPVLGMKIFSSITFCWYKITNIYHQNNSIFIWVVDDVYRTAFGGWCSLTHFFVMGSKLDFKHNWLKEGF